MFSIRMLVALFISRGLHRIESWRMMDHSIVLYENDKKEYPICLGQSQGPYSLIYPVSVALCTLIKIHTYVS